MVADIMVMIFLLVYTWKHVYYAIFNKNNLKILIAGVLIIFTSVFLYPIIDKALLEAMPSMQTLIYSLDIIFIVLIDAIIYLGVLLISKENLISSFFRKSK